MLSLRGFSYYLQEVQKSEYLYLYKIFPDIVSIFFFFFFAKYNVLLQLYITYLKIQSK